MALCSYTSIRLHRTFFALLLYIGVCGLVTAVPVHNAATLQNGWNRKKRIGSVEKYQKRYPNLAKKASLRHGDSTTIALFISGGAAFSPLRQKSSSSVSTASPSTPDQNSSTTNTSFSTLKTITKITIAVIIAAFSWECRHAIKIFFESITNTEKIKSNVLSILETLQSKGGYKGVIFYMLFLILWEMIGISTIPLETAAGMVFGVQKGLLASGFGRITGAMLAYALGRICFKEYVRSKLSDNEVLSLIEKSMTSKPLVTSLIMKYSIFPETIKNYGLSVMTPVKPWIFALATFIHGFPYTVLWTNLGWDSALRLKALEVATTISSTGGGEMGDGGGSQISSSPPPPPNRLLGGAVIFVTAFTIVGSPTIMALWIRDLRMKHLGEKKENDGGGVKKGI